MYSINKERFGAFIAQLRRDKGLTQKELAEKLFLSDKAVSKWETGASLPDTTLLLSLAELLGVSVAELLRGERIDDTPIEAGEVDSLVQSAIAYPAADDFPLLRRKKIWHTLYPLSAVVSAGITALYYITRSRGTTPLMAMIFGIVFGAYFCFFAREKLPRYYDEYRIGGFQDGFFRMNMPGLHLNNSNWPYILLAGRLWSCISMVLFPALAICLCVFLPAIWQRIELPLFLLLFLGGWVVPIYVVGKKYE